MSEEITIVSYLEHELLADFHNICQAVLGVQHRYIPTEELIAKYSQLSPSDKTVFDEAVSAIASGLDACVCRAQMWRDEFTHRTQILSGEDVIARLSYTKYD